jgi:hypothetical protein
VSRIGAAIAQENSTGSHRAHLLTATAIGSRSQPRHEPGVSGAKRSNDVWSSRRWILLVCPAHRASIAHRPSGVPVEFTGYCESRSAASTNSTHVIPPRSLAHLPGVRVQHTVKIGSGASAEVGAMTPAVVSGWRRPPR